MKEHIKRKIEIARDLIPEKGTEAYNKLIETQDRYINQNPKFAKQIKENFQKAQNTLELQYSNGIGLNMDSELRYFLYEFNHRSWTYSHRKMPIMFNIMEAFFNLDKTINSWKLLEEEDYQISFFDYLDFYTSNDLNYDLNVVKENFEENLIYNYNVGDDINEITFKTDDGSEFVIAGVSLVRRGNEVTFLFLTGEMIDTVKITNDLEPLTKSEIPGKEMLKPDEDKVREAVKLNEDPNLWKVQIACRLDLESETVDARYIAKDTGNSFIILTDDITGFLKNGDWIFPSLNETFDDLVTSVENYNSIFELAKASLFIPYYFNVFNEHITEKGIDTPLKKIINNPLKKLKFNRVENKYKIRTRSLWSLDRNNKFTSDRIILRDDSFKVETGGYWKKLQLDELGTDKKGRPVTGKTWVSQTESYYQAKTDELIVSNNEKIEFTGKDSGYIYVMRNATFEEDIFKIGLTTKQTKERAKQLSKTSVADQFYVMREWAVKDCRTAEKEIHTLLDDYRVDPRREFFKLDMRVATETIDSVVDRINK